MASSGPNIQLELRLAEMARMNEEIKRRHMEVEADKLRAVRGGNMVTPSQSITMQTQMPADYDGSREDGFKDGLDSRPLPADPYGKDRIPRDKRGKPGDQKLKKGKKEKLTGVMSQQTIDEARQKGIGDSEFWRLEQAKCDAARISRARGRDGTWKREWDREKHGEEERSYKGSNHRRVNDKSNRHMGQPDRFQRNRHENPGHQHRQMRDDRGSDRGSDHRNDSRSDPRSDPRSDRGDRSGYGVFRDQRRSDRNPMRSSFDGPQRRTRDEPKPGSTRRQTFDAAPTRPGGRYENRQKRHGRGLGDTNDFPPRQENEIKPFLDGASGSTVIRQTALADYETSDDDAVSNNMSDYDEGPVVPAPPSIDSSPTEEDYEKYDQEVSLPEYEDHQASAMSPELPDEVAPERNEIEEELAQVLEGVQIASEDDVEKTDHIKDGSSEQVAPLEQSDLGRSDPKPISSSDESPLAADVEAVESKTESYQTPEVKIDNEEFNDKDDPQPEPQPEPHREALEPSTNVEDVKSTPTQADSSTKEPNPPEEVETTPVTTTPSTEASQSEDSKHLGPKDNTNDDTN